MSQEGDSCILCIVNLELAGLRINIRDHTTLKANDQPLFSDWMASLQDTDCEYGYCPVTGDGWATSSALSLTSKNHWLAR